MRKEDLMDEEPEIKKGHKKDKEPKSGGGWKNNLRVAVMMIALCVFVYSAYNLFFIFKEYREGEKEYENLKQYTSFPEEIKEEETVEETAEEAVDDSYIEVDFDKLKSINPDIVAWLYIPGAGISYPVTKTTDNSYYLNHTFEGKENHAGSIFMDYLNDSGFADTNTLLYGHNMKNGSMFGLLKRYKEQEYYQKHPSFWISTQAGKYRYQIFASYVTQAASISYTMTFATEEEYAEYIKTAKEQAAYDTGTDVTTADKIVTLSTCTSVSEDSRFVVQAKLVESIVNE